MSGQREGTAIEMFSVSKTSASCWGFQQQESSSQAFLIQLLLQIASLTLRDLVLHNLACASSMLMDLGCYIYSVRTNALRADARGSTSDGYNSTASQWLPCLAHVHPAW